MDSDGKWVTIRGHRVFIKDKDVSNYMNNKIRSVMKYNDSSFKYLPDDDDKAYDKYVEMSEESYNNMSKDDVDYINNHYVKQNESDDFNEALRKNMQVDEKLKNAMDNACKSYTLKENMAGTRFVTFDYLRSEYKLNIERYGDVDRSKIAEQMKKYIGSDVTSKAYTSISLNESGNGMFGNMGVKIKVNMPKGTKMYVADNVGEYEAILGRNTRMILKAVDFKKSKIQGFENEYGKVLLTYEVVE